MTLKYAEEGGDVSAHVVDHFLLWCRAPAEEDAAHSNERLGVAAMRDCVYALAHARCEVSLPADVWCGAGQRHDVAAKRAL